MENKTSQKMNYGVYCRKSSESEERQVLSLDSQIDKAKQIGLLLGVKISEKYTFSESKSAKVTNNRIEFSRMLSAIERKEISGIIVWHADRLSRNAIDTALLLDLMDRGKLIEIVTPGQTFRNTPIDKFMFGLSCGQAKMENDKKGIDVRRGLSKTAEMGNFPSVAPIGYLNDKFAPKGQKRVRNDNDRFPIVRHAWELMLTGTYTPHKILEIATEEWGLRSKNGKKLSESLIYWMFRNSFYYGMFEYPKGTGLWHQGNHTPMITVEEFDRVQVLLGKKGKPRPKTHVFDFTGMMHCGECRAMITAETKTKHQKNGNTHNYVYYHCTKKKTPNCSQGSIEIKELNKQIIKAIDEVEIPPEFHAFGMKWFAKENEREAGEHTAVLGGHQKAYNAVVTKLDRLIDMRANGELGQEEFAQKQAEYLEEKKAFKSLLDRTDVRIDQWNRTADEMLTFIEQAKEKFTNGSIQVRKRILSTLGSNLIIKDKILSIDIEKSLFPMKKISKEVKAIKERLEPVSFTKSVANKGLKEKTNDFSSVFSTGLRG